MFDSHSPAWEPKKKWRIWRAGKGERVPSLYDPSDRDQGIPSKTANCGSAKQPIVNTFFLLFTKRIEFKLHFNASIFIGACSDAWVQADLFHGKIMLDGFAARL